MRFLVCFFLTLSFSGCDKNNLQLREALILAGENRIELEKVLDHFKNDPQKFKAAHFLIQNMPGHVGYTSSYIQKFQPIYNEYANISSSYNWERSKEWYNAIDSLWTKEKEKQFISFQDHESDIETVEAEWLINQIDLAYHAWKENVYTKDCSFETFCEYILPYRIIDKTVRDNSRQIFYERHAGVFSDPSKDFREASDSLHYQYSFLQHNDFAALSLPVVDTHTIEQIKRITCDDMAWYNVSLMTSLGMAIGIDFVPAWGNRNGSHRWNALIMDKNTYPFEPFWDNDRWKYKRIYNNTTIDVIHGKFRLPKVFRHTYKCNNDILQLLNTSEKSHIPNLFLDPFIKDVSSEYFKTTDLEIKLPEKKKEHSYCYLYVFGSKGFQPVQWAKIKKNNNVIFKNMGHDIVYFPMYFLNGNHIPVLDPFLLDAKGEIKELKPTNEKQSITIGTYTSYFSPEEIEESKQLIRGAKLIMYDNNNSSNNSTLLTFSDTIDLFYNRIETHMHEEGQYFKLLSSCEEFGLCEICFYEETDNGLKKIPNVKVTGSLTPLNPEKESLELIVDNLSATGFKGIFENEKELWFDLGKPYRISRIEFVPYTQSYVEKPYKYELFHWNNKKWELLETKEGDDKPITFHDVPKGGLFRLKKGVDYSTERIFTYEDGWIHWY